MKSSILKDLTILILIFASIWLCITFLYKDKESTPVLSTENEEKMGEFFFKALTKDPQFQPVESEYVDSCISLMISRITDSLHSDYQYKIYVFNNSMINAFALPGGYIMVSSGLIQLSDKPEEFVAVVSHEIGHIEKKHLVMKLIKELGLSILTSNDPFLVGEASKTAASTAYDRRKEKEADQFALELMQNASIDPRILGLFFRKIKEEDLAYDKRFEMMMTHPDNESRIRMALEYKLPEGFKSVPIDISWSSIKDALNETIDNPYPGEKDDEENGKDNQEKDIKYKFLSSVQD